MEQERKCKSCLQYKREGLFSKDSPSLCIICETAILRNINRTEHDKAPKIRKSYRNKRFMDKWVKDHD